MPFAVATLITNVGKAIFADRVRATPATYTVAPHWGAVGSGATGAARTAAVTDTALSTERARASGTESVLTTSVSGDTEQLATTLSITGTWALDEFGMFDAASSGNMFFSATMNVINLVNGDSLIVNSKTQLT